MKCVECSEEAAAICKFCGRAVCREHIKTNVFMSGYTGFGGAFSFTTNGVRIEDAVWCGLCHPLYKTTA